MTGVIVTGHGNYASGMLSAVRLLTGESERLRAVDFLPKESEDTLKQHLEEALSHMRELDHIYILCDILGGSPFKMSCILGRDRPHIHILYGINLPVLLDISMDVAGNLEIGDPKARGEALLAEGKKHMGNVQNTVSD